MKISEAIDNIIPDMYSLFLACSLESLRIGLRKMMRVILLGFGNQIRDCLALLSLVALEMPVS